MDTPDFNAAAAFVAASARLLDRRRFERLFEDGPPEPVRDAVAAYRNPDGGFGHGLEPDCRARAASPPRRRGAAHDGRGGRLGRGPGAGRVRLAGGQWRRDEGGAAFVEPTLAGWPHAPWWVSRGGQPASLIATGMMAGELHARG